MPEIENVTPLIDDPPKSECATEEAVIAKAWARSGFSIRKLQKIVAATLDARDAVAARN
jgi:hypothetical protein